MNQFECELPEATGEVSKNCVRMKRPLNRGTYTCRRCSPLTNNSALFVQFNPCCDALLGLNMVYVILYEDVLHLVACIILY